MKVSPLRVLVALGFLLLALAVRMPLGPWLGNTFSHSSVLLAVLFSAWWCGTLPAVLVALVGYPAVESLILGHLAIPENLAYAAGSLGLYCACAALLIFLTNRYRSEHARLQASANELLETASQLQESLQRQRRIAERFKTGFDHMPVGIGEVGADHRFVAVNASLCQLLGYGADELTARTDLEVIAPEYRSLVEQLASELGEGAADRLDCELQLVRKEGSRVWVHAKASAIRDGVGRHRYSIASFDDISGRKQLEDSMRHDKLSAERDKAAADRANQAKDEFLAVLSHELRTPLTPILASVQLLQRREEDMRQTLEVIQRNTQLEARLIDDLLDLNRISEGKLVLERKPVNVSTVIERAVEVAKPNIEARPLRFGVELNDVPQQVNGDVARLQQVVWNLLSNAIKFTPDGGTIGVKCWTQGDRVVIEVADTGIGIEKENLTRIFEAFEQGGRGITRQFGGLGLGLAIAKRLVELHEGTIAVHSDGNNKGATFRVSLPLSREHAKESTKAPRSAVVATSRRILLVEDNGDTAAMMKMLLESFGYHVATAREVTQALEALGCEAFDLLISDLGLPGRSGLELMREIRSRGNPLKAIALSGYGREEDLQRSREAGFTAHLIKPVDADTLLENVEAVLASRASVLQQGLRINPGRAGVRPVAAA